MSIQTMLTGPIFGICSTVMVILVVYSLFLLWKTYARRFKKYQETFNSLPAEKKNEAKSLQPSFLFPLVMTVFVVGSFVLLVVSSWSFLQTVTTTQSNYESPAAIEYNKKVMETKAPTLEQMEEAKAKIDKPQAEAHQKALSNFDSAMEAEAKKIRQRSLGETSQKDKQQSSDVK